MIALTFKHKCSLVLNIDQCKSLMNLIGLVLICTILADFACQMSPSLPCTFCIETVL